MRLPWRPRGGTALARVLRFERAVAPPIPRNHLTMEQATSDSPSSPRGPFAFHPRTLSRASSVKTQPVASFSSLRGDASLIAPHPDLGSFPHLASFLRTAPPGAVTALFRAVAQAVRKRLEPCCWLSMSGLGVPWLHVRIDDRPKYYSHAPYR